MSLLKFRGTYGLNQGIQDATFLEFRECLRTALLARYAKTIRDTDEGLNFDGGIGSIGLALSMSVLKLISRGDIKIIAGKGIQTVVKYSYEMQFTPYALLVLPVFFIVRGLLVEPEQAATFIPVSIFFFCGFAVLLHHTKDRFVSIIQAAEKIFLENRAKALQQNKKPKLVNKRMHQRKNRNA